jgi:anaerobic C4-dicarboxylate transporter
MAFKLSIKNIALFAFVWLNIGFALGFLVLMGPVRWAADYSRDNDFPESKANLMVRAIILLFIVISFIAALFVSSRVINSQSSRRKVFVPLICLGFGLFALHEFLNPQNLASLSNSER